LTTAGARRTAWCSTHGKLAAAPHGPKVDAVHAGPRNDITDVSGVLVGHHQRRSRGWCTGTTVVVPPDGTVGGVDVRGGGPGTRETDLLAPVNMVDRVDAVCLTGGSAYGLAAADGVMTWLAEQHRGFVVGSEPHEVVPIVPAAVLFDLGLAGSFTNRPDASFGYRAAKSARSRPVAQGTVGAGTGAHLERLKGGVGSASVVLDSGVTVGALAVLNSSGFTFDPSTGELYGIGWGLPGEFDHLQPPSGGEITAFHAIRDAEASFNTTLVVVATDARMEKHECTRMAGSAHDGMARAISPIHLYGDGDVAFALATGAREIPDERREGAFRPASTRPGQLGLVLAAAADVVARAIVHATVSATSVSTPTGGLTSYCDHFSSARR
jgi:L-aminopeptidase/D-esterase-like protein